MIINYPLLLSGCILSFIGFCFAMARKNNPNYYSIFSKSETIQNLLLTISFLLYPGSYLLIIFSSGLKIKNIILGLIAVAIVNFVVFPIIWGTIEGIRARRKLINKR